MTFVGAFAEKPQGKRCFPDLPRSADKDHLSLEAGGDGLAEISGGVHNMDNTPVYSLVK